MSFFLNGDMMVEDLQKITSAMQLVQSLRDDLRSAESELDKLRRSVPSDVKIRLRSLLGERYRIPPGEAERGIVDTIKARGPMRVSELAKELVSARMTMHVAANRLVEKGVLKREFEGRTQVFSLANGDDRVVQ